jgi:hypothetical protein
MNLKLILVFLILFFLIGFFLGVSLDLIFFSIILFILFTFFKASAFLFTVNSDKKISFFDSVKLFFICDFIEFISFTGKIGSDIVKVYFLKKIFGLKQSISLVLLFRLITFISTLIFFIFLLNYFFGILIFIIIFLFLLKIKRELSLSLTLNILSDATRVALFALIFSIFGIIINNQILLYLLVANTLGRLITFTPHGLGIQEFIFSLGFYSNLGLIDFAKANFVVRAFTIVPSIFLGFIFTSKGLIKKIKNFSKSKSLIKINLIKNYFSFKKLDFLIILFIICLVFLSFLSFEFNLLFKLLFVGTISGLSNSKIILFLLITLVFFILSKSNFMTKKVNNNLIFLLIILLSFLSLFSLLFFYHYNSLPFSELGLIYSNSSDTFTFNSPFHYHSFKPAMFPFTNQSIGFFDTGPEFYSFLPSWFILVYLLGFFIFLILFLFLIKKFLSFSLTVRKEKLIFFIAGFFMFSNGIFDGGIFNHLFITGLILLLIALKDNFFIFNLKKTEFSLTFIFGIIGNIFENFLLFLSNLAFFNSLNNFFNKKGLQKLLWLFLVILIVFLSIYGGRREIDTFNMFSAPLSKGELLIAFPEYINTSNLEIFDNSSFFPMVVYFSKKDQSMKDIFKRKDNEKVVYYVFKWKRLAEHLRKDSTLFLYTSEEIPFNYSSNFSKLLKNIKIEKISDNHYSVSFSYSVFIKDYKKIFVEYFKSQGLKNFILFE